MQVFTVLHNIGLQIVGCIKKMFNLFEKQKLKEGPGDITSQCLIERPKSLELVSHIDNLWACHHLLEDKDCMTS